MTEGDLIWKLITIGSMFANCVMGYVMWATRNAKADPTPQPFLVKMEEKFVTKSALEERHRDLERRVDALEKHRENDKAEILEKIDAIPRQVIALLKDTKGLI